MLFNKKRDNEIFANNQNTIQIGWSLLAVLFIALLYKSFFISPNYEKVLFFQTFFAISTISYIKINNKDIWKILFFTSGLLCFIISNNSMIYHYNYYHSFLIWCLLSIIFMLCYKKTIDIIIFQILLNLSIFFISYEYLIPKGTINITQLIFVISFINIATKLLSNKFILQNKNYNLFSVFIITTPLFLVSCAAFLGFFIPNAYIIICLFLLSQIYLLINNKKEKINILLSIIYLSFFISTIAFQITIGSHFITFSKAFIFSAELFIIFAITIFCINKHCKLKKQIVEYILALICSFIIISSLFIFFLQTKSIHNIANNMIIYGFITTAMSTILNKVIKNNFIKILCIYLFLFGTWILIGGFYQNNAYNQIIPTTIAIIAFSINHHAIKSKIASYICSSFICIFSCAYIINTHNYYVLDIIFSSCFILSLFILLRTNKLNSLVFCLLFTIPGIYIYHDLSGIESILWVHNPDIIYAKIIALLSIFFILSQLNKNKDKLFLKTFFAFSLILTIYCNISFIAMLCIFLINLKKAEKFINITLIILLTYLSFPIIDKNIIKFLSIIILFLSPYIAKEAIRWKK